MRLRNIHRREAAVASLAVLLLLIPGLGTGLLSPLPHSPSDRGALNVTDVRQSFKSPATSDPLQKISRLLHEYLRTGQPPTGVRLYPAIPTVPRWPEGVNPLGDPARYRLQPLSTPASAPAVGVLLMTDKSVPPEQVRAILPVEMVLPLPDGYIYIAAATAPNQLLRAAELPGTIGIQADVLGALRGPSLPNPLTVLNPPTVPAQVNATQIVGAARAARDFGITGSGVTLAMMDTGVDFGLRELTQARNTRGIPLSLDTTGEGIIVATLDLQPIGTLLPTQGRPIIVHWRGEYFQTYFTKHDEFAELGNIHLSPAQLAASKSGKFRIGLFAYDDNAIGLWLVPFVMIDTQQAGIYDTVYFDLSTTYAQLMKLALSIRDGNRTRFRDTLRLNLDQLLDFSIADEQPHRWGDGSEVIARDFNGDGRNDLSLGSLAWVRDTKRPGATNQTIPGLGTVDKQIARRVRTDTLGVLPQEWSILGYQWAGDETHGTWVANAAAGRGLADYFFISFPHNRTRIPGIAPGARILALNAGLQLSASNIFAGWLWAAGLTVTPDGRGYTYDPTRHADIISNSFGIPQYIATDPFTPGVDPEAVFANLLSLPGILHPAYPGTTLVIATGNSGWGYGSVETPGVASLVIGVGGSTENFWISYLGSWLLDEKGRVARFSVDQGFDEVVDFSSRGPTTLGEVKPDLVAPAGPVIVSLRAVNWWWWPGFFRTLQGTGPLWGFIVGDGFYLGTVGAGTSISTPMVAGGAALVIEALRSGGIPVTPQLVKSILLNGAADLGYDAFQQGAGRLDVHRAVALALAKAGTAKPGTASPALVTTGETYRQLRTQQNPASQLALQTQAPVRAGQLPDVSVPSATLYAGRFRPGESRTLELTIENFAGGIPEVRPLQLLRTATYNLFVRVDHDPYFVNLADLIRMQGGSLEQLRRATLLRVFLLTAQPLHHDQKLDTPDLAYLIDWRDENGNGQYELLEEQHRISNDGRFGAVLQLTAGLPASDFQRTPAIIIRNRNYNFRDQPPIDQRIVLELFERRPWPAVTIAAPPSSARNTGLTVQIQPPVNASPGIYDGVLQIATGGGSQRLTQYTPVSFAVTAPLSRASTIQNFPASDEDPATPYRRLHLFGGEEQSGFGSWNIGDFRIIPVEVRDPGAADLVVAVDWVHPHSQNDVILVTPELTLALTTPIMNRGGGAFEYSTTSGASRQVLVANVTGRPGVYTLIVHNTLAAALAQFPENLIIRALYTTQPVLRHIWTAERGSIQQGWIGGSLTLRVEIAPEAAPLLAVRSLAAAPGKVLTLEGQVTNRDPIWRAPFRADGWPDRPTTRRSVHIDQGTKVTASIDWDVATDIDLVILQPDGQPLPNWERAATLAKPEVIEFVAAQTGNYTLMIVLFDGGDSTYKLRLSLGGTGTRQSGDTLTLDTKRFADRPRLDLLVDVSTNAVFSPRLDLRIPPLQVGVDNTPPRLQVKGIQDNTFLFGAIDVTINATDVFLRSVTLQIDDGPPRPANATGERLDLAEGDHRIRIEARDALHVTHQEFRVHVDRSIPTIDIRGLSAEEIVAGLLNFTATTRQLYFERMVLRVDAQPESEALVATSLPAAFSLDTRKLGDGVHVLTLIARFTSGREVQRSMVSLVDNTPPFVALTALTAGPVTRPPVTIDVQVRDAHLATAILRVGGQRFDVANTTRLELTQLGDGQHLLVLEAVDRAGNRASTQVVVTLDGTPPTVRFDSPLPSTSVVGRVPLTFTAEDAHLVAVQLRIGDVVYDVTGARGFLWDTTPLPDGEYTLTLHARDAAGNESSTTLMLRTNTQFQTLLTTLVPAIVVSAGIGFGLGALLLRRRH